MINKDVIYGKFEVKEPVLLELLKTPSLLRLKKLSQYGIPDKYYHHKNFSRYEHSIGVMLLLRILGASLEEQVAGLLHDVSTTAFSHIADWVFAKGSEGIEEFQNITHEKFLSETEIPKILNKHDFLTQRIYDYENFGLLERKIPDLCADRVDYALREFKYWLNPKIVKGCLDSLINFKGEMVFNNEESAFDFGVNFLELQTRHWGGYEAVVRYEIFSRALRLAIREKVISENDFFKDERFILLKIEKTKVKQIRKILSILKNKDLSYLKKRKGKRVYKKFRYVDPKVALNVKVKKLSEINNEFKKEIERHKKINQKGILVPDIFHYDE